MNRTSPSASRIARGLAPLVAGALVLAACGGDDSTTSSTVPVSPRITVTSVAGDAESELLAAIYARVLEDAGFRVTRRDPVELDREGYYAEVQAGTIDLIPEWTGELLSFVYAQPDAGPAPTTVVPDAPASTQAPVTLATTTTLAPADSTPGTDASTTTTASTTPDTAAVTTTTAPLVTGRAMLEQIVALQAGLPDTVTINAGALAEKKDVIACTADAMDANADVELATYTNLASIAPEIRLGASAEWQADEETGLPAFTLFYGGEFAEVVTVDDAAASIEAGDVDCLVLGSLDPLITTERLTILFDDRSMEPANGAIALLSAEMGTPDVVAAVDSIAMRLTTERLNQMLNQVAQGTDPVVVANAFVDTV